LKSNHFIFLRPVEILLYERGHPRAPLVNPFHNVFFSIYEDNYFINCFKTKLLRKWVNKDSSICGMSVDLPGAASQETDPFLETVDIGCGRDVSVFVTVSFPLAHPTDTLCPLVYILYENPNHETLNPKPFTPEPVLV
jgi:hypothetical protein